MTKCNACFRFVTLTVDQHIWDTWLGSLVVSSLITLGAIVDSGFQFNSTVCLKQIIAITSSIKLSNITEINIQLIISKMKIPRDCKCNRETVL